MGWVKEESKKRLEATGDPSTGADSLESNARELECWNGLLRGLSRDVEEFERGGGNCTLEKLADLRCKITNFLANVAVVVTADLSARTIEYRYESEDARTAVPENGFLTMRPSDGTARIYSADQPLSSEQARQLILEPLLFPTLPTDAAAAQV
jgi:hypothetical protein